MLLVVMRPLRAQHLGEWGSHLLHTAYSEISDPLMLDRARRSWQRMLSSLSASHTGQRQTGVAGDADSGDVPLEGKPPPGAGLLIFCHTAFPRRRGARIRRGQKKVLEDAARGRNGIPGAGLLIGCTIYNLRRASHAIEGMPVWGTGLQLGKPLTPDRARAIGVVTCYELQCSPWSLPPGGAGVLSFCTPTSQSLFLSFQSPRTGTVAASQDGT